MVLEKRFSSADQESWYYENEIEGWFCSYKPLTTKHFVLLVKSSDPDKLIEEDYLQFLFHFYCHQLQMLQGTYRDALTGLYNRRAFNEKIAQLLDRSDNHQRRAISFSPTIYVMLDIDHFKLINDSQGHLFGDEVLLLLAQQMTDSFRENDLLFRYGGEEFAMVLMDIGSDQAQLTLDRFREKIANFHFPGRRTGNGQHWLHLVRQPPFHGPADRTRPTAALYYCKSTTRNAVHSYQELVEKGLDPSTQGIKKSPHRNVLKLSTPSLANQRLGMTLQTRYQPAAGNR